MTTNTSTTNTDQSKLEDEITYIFTVIDNYGAQSEARKEIAHLIEQRCNEAVVGELKRLQSSETVSDEIKDYLWDNYVYARLAQLTNKKEAKS